MILLLDVQGGPPQPCQHCQGSWPAWVPSGISCSFEVRRWKPLFAVLSPQSRPKLQHTECVMQDVWHLQPAGAHEQDGAAR